VILAANLAVDFLPLTCPAACPGFLRSGPELGGPCGRVGAV